MSKIEEVIRAICPLTQPPTLDWLIVVTIATFWIILGITGIILALHACANPRR